MGQVDVAPGLRQVPPASPGKYVELMLLRITAVERIDDAGSAGHHNRRAAPRGKRHVALPLEVERAVSRECQRAIVNVQRQDAVVSRQPLRDQVDRQSVGICRVEVDQRQAGGSRERRVAVRFGEKAELGQCIRKLDVPSGRMLLR